MGSPFISPWRSCGETGLIARARDDRELQSEPIPPRMGDVTRWLDRWHAGDPTALAALMDAGVRRAASARRRAAARRAGRPHPPADGPGPRGLPAARRDPGDAAGEPPALLRRGGAGDAADPGRLRPAAEGVEARRPGGARGAARDAILEAPVDLRLDFEHVDQALERLAAVAPEKAKVAELRYFAGLSVEETGEVLGISPATVKRHWTFARAWLYRALERVGAAAPVRLTGPGGPWRIRSSGRAWMPCSTRPSRSRAIPRPREALIAREAGGDEAVAAEVRSLLAAHDRSGGVPRAGRGRSARAACARHARRRLPAGREDRRGRHGRGLPRRAGRRPLRPARSPLKVTRGGLLDPGAARAVRHRAPDPRHAAASAHRHAPRRRHDARRARLPRDGAGRRRPDHDVLRGPAARSRGAAGAVPPGLRRGALRAPARDRPSRSQAGQRPRHRRRRAQGPRLRRRQAARGGARRRADRPGPPAGAADAELRQPGAAPRPAGDDGVRRLRARRAALRAGHRQPAVRDHGPAARSRDRSRRPHRADAPERRAPRPTGRR